MVVYLLMGLATLIAGSYLWWMNVRKKDPSDNIFITMLWFVIIFCGTV